ncbi:MAG: HlyC/CorC family transporter [Brevinematales bacterium]|nr:HlyC/CorC family transporter [Brevinematales bacterium]
MEILIAAGFIILAGFFAGSETGFMSLDRIHLHANLDTKDLRYKALDFLHRYPEDMIGAMLLGTNACIVAATLIFTSYLGRVLPGDPLIPLYVTLIETPTVLLISDVIPKIIFRKFADPIMHGLSFLYLLIFIIFYPFQFIFVKTIKMLLSIFRRGKKVHGTISREEFQEMLNMSADKGFLMEKEKEYIESIMNFKNVTAREVMVPQNRVVGVEENDSVAKAVELMIKSHHSKLPVFSKRIFNIIGFVDNKSLLTAKKDDPIKHYIQKSIYFPEIIPIDKLIVEMQSSIKQMVFLVDEYGGTSGVITSNDLVTEIVGEFMELGGGEIEKKGDEYIIKGSLDIDDMNDELRMGIKKEGFETIAGFLLHRMQRLPKAGDVYEEGRYRFEIKSIKEFRIDRIIVSLRRKAGAKKKNVKQKADNDHAAG